MMSHLMAVSDEWQAEERRRYRAEIERLHRAEEARSQVGYVSATDRARSCVAELLRRLAAVLDTCLADATPRATAAAD